MTLSAYSKIPKAAFLAELEEHRRADRLVQGYAYWSEGRGCAIGCSVASINRLFGADVIPRKVTSSSPPRSACPGG